MLLNHKNLVVRVVVLAVLGVVVGLAVRALLSSDDGSEERHAADFQPFASQDDGERPHPDDRRDEAGEHEAPVEMAGEDMAGDGAPRGLTARAEPADEYFARPENEWQGMRVEKSSRPPCEASRFCGRALACIGEKCLPCEHDADCARGESCVLDHCVASQRVECRSERDCGEGALCILTGYSSDPRGNSTMRAVCQSDTGGEAVEAALEEHAEDGEPEAAEDDDRVAAPRRELAPANLMERARSAERGE